jgi:hypothetical protein
MDDVDELVISPFREIVEKGKLAIGNAGDGQPIMAKAAQMLVKEGERGLKRIEPLCKKQFEDYGVAFVAALKDNGKCDLWCCTNMAKLTRLDVLQMRLPSIAPS